VTAPSIEVEDLRHAFGRPVLEGITFSIQPGQVVGYLGPNGAGKSTTIKVLTGMLAPDGGRVRVLGRDPQKEPLEVRARIGYVPESGALFETLTPDEYLGVVGRLHGLADAVVADRVDRMLSAFDLRGRRRSRMTSFSKGMKQKVAIASALLHDPEIVFLDEPLNGLDANATVVVKEVVRGLAARGRTVFYSSHLLDVVERVCDRVLILDHGRIVADGSAADLRASAGDASLEAVFSRLTAGDEVRERARELLDALGPGAPP
jgi:ABC-2 type transport system ATP-binding protein